MTTEEELRQETDTWEERLHDRLAAVSATDEAGEELLENAAAYADDVDHFREDGDMVRAFEAVIWAWAWLEIGEQLGHLDD